MKQNNTLPSLFFLWLEGKTKTHKALIINTSLKRRFVFFRKGLWQINNSVFLNPCA